MALGFGSFRAAGKILPGVYINLVGGSAERRAPAVDVEPGQGDEVSITTENQKLIVTEKELLLIV